MEEFIARVRALLRRSAGQGTPVMEAGDISLDTRHMQVLRRGVPLSLSPLEYRLLAYLIHQQGRVVSSAELLEHLYGDGDSREANALEAVIARLRRKVGADTIETRRGFGYVLRGEPA
jgi:DNA-binding response OmpR family regulator